jgi:hypothetical protein
MGTGFESFATGVFVWARIDYNRFIKFWMLRPAPYTRHVRLVFRLFFVACVLGGVWQIAGDIAKYGKPVVFCLTALPFTVAWFVVFFWYAALRRTAEPEARDQQQSFGVSVSIAVCNVAIALIIR